MREKILIKKEDFIFIIKNVKAEEFGPKLSVLRKKEMSNLILNYLKSYFSYFSNFFPSLIFKYKLDL